MTINSISKILCLISTIVFLSSFREPSLATVPSKASYKAIWSIPIGIGINWKPKAEAAEEHNRWIGGVAITGIKWEKLFCKRYTFSAGLLWGLFLPDMFMEKEPTTWYGSFFGIDISMPYNLALLLPMTSLQLGCLCNSQWHFSCGLVYLCGLECNVHYLIFPKISLNGKLCFFLDKFLKNDGIHLGFATVGIDYRLFM